METTLLKFSVTLHLPPPPNVENTNKSVKYVKKKPLLDKKVVITVPYNYI